MLTDLIDRINRESYESKENMFTTINVRPNEKIMAMLDLMNQLEGKNPATSLSEEFSYFIYRFLTEHEEHIPILEKIIEADLPQTGANRLLHEKGVFEPNIRFDL